MYRSINLVKGNFKTTLITECKQKDSYLPKYTENVKFLSSLNKTASLSNMRKRCVKTQNSQ